MTWLEIIEPLRKSAPSTWRTIQRARLVEIGPDVLRLHFTTGRKGETTPADLPEKIKAKLLGLVGLRKITITTEDAK